MLHDEFAASEFETLVNLRFGASTVAVPPLVLSVPHVPDASVINVSPTGSTLFHETCARAIVFGFATVIVRFEVPPPATEVGLNAAVITGGAAVTFTLFDVPLTAVVLSVTVIVCADPFVLKVAVKELLLNCPLAGRLAAGSVLLNWNVSVVLVIALLNASFSVIEPLLNATPGTCDAGIDTVMDCTGPGLTVTLFEVPVMDEVPVSVAVIVCVPFVWNVAPLVKV
jgi:hypothetical protein